MSWLYYLIEANIYLCIFYAFYNFVLKQEPLYTLNRWYLLLSALTSFMLPFFTVNYSSPVQQLTMPHTNNIVYDYRPSIVIANQSHLQQNSSSASFWNEDKIVVFMYLAVVLYFFMLSFKEIFRLMMLYRRLGRHQQNKVVYIDLPDTNEEVFSFFNWLFLHPKMHKNQAIIAHELVHIKQGHTYDVLFFEFLRCINWFNPCTYLLFNDAKLNHEYIADRHTSAKMGNKYDYANLLIEHAYFSAERLSHSAFSQSQLEWRIMHLGKQNAKRGGFLKYLALFPLVLLLFFVAAFKVEKSYGWIKLNVKDQQVSKVSKVPTNFSSSNSISPKGKLGKSDTSVKHMSMQFAAVTAIPEPELSELVSGPTTMEKIAAEMAKKGEKLYAIDYELYWAINRTNDKIRKVVHSICVGTESQLFRGKWADTLYVDKGFYSIEDGIVKVKTDNLLISAMEFLSETDKRLVVIDASKRKTIATLNGVDIRTKGLIHTIVRNPHFGYGNDGIVDSVPNKYVDVKKRDADRKYVSNVMNLYIREARVTANEIITNETKQPKQDLPQPGILW